MIPALPLRSNGDAHSGFTTGDGLVIEPQISHTLTSGGADASEDGTGRGAPVIAFGPRYFSRDNKTGGAPSGTVALSATNAMKSGDAAPHVAGQFGVRRLTPTECARLQGFPDDWNAFSDDGKPISDSARYKQLGNAVCVPTAEWIARRIIESLEISS